MNYVYKFDVWNIYRLFVVLKIGLNEIAYLHKLSAIDKTKYIVAADRRLLLWKKIFVTNEFVF